jgi:hypothetical protein
LSSRFASQVRSRFVRVLKRGPKSDNVKGLVGQSGFSEISGNHITGSKKALGFFGRGFSGFYAKAIPFR